MLHGEQRNAFQLSFELPAVCADKLASGAVDIGLVPVAEIPRLGLTPFPGVGIACEGEVRSILLISKVPISDIETLAADSSSRTSVKLTRIILEKRYGVRPRVITHAPDLPAMLSSADAALVIGDPALLIDPESLPFEVLDLGQEWFLLTGLPMVFAMWSGRRGFTPSSKHGAEWARSFTDSWLFGKEHLEDIVKLEHEGRGLAPDLVREYFNRYIVFELGERHQQGMERFLQYAAELQHQEAGVSQS